MKIIGQLIVCNGEEFLEETLNGIVNRIRDLNVIAISDGAWENSCYKNILSTDKTMEIIEKFIQDNPRIDVLVKTRNEKFYRNPSEKRNEQLKDIFNEFGNERYYTFWFDDDEEIRFTNGREEIWLRDYLKNYDVPIFLNTFGWNSEKPMLTPRFIPGNNGYHWHTERAMCIHDSNCNIVFDWTPGQEKQELDILTNHEMFIVNKWNKKSRKELQRKSQYAMYENKLYETPEKCKWLEDCISAS